MVTRSMTTRNFGVRSGVRNARRQRGFTWGNFLMLVLLLCLALVGIRLAPVYLDSFSVKESLKSLGEEDLSQYSKNAIADALIKRLDISAVKTLTSENFDESVTIDKKGKKTDIIVDYRVERALVGNLSIVADFHHELHQ